MKRISGFFYMLMFSVLVFLMAFVALIDTRMVDKVMNNFVSDIKEKY